MKSNKDMHIFEYLKNKAAHLNSSFCRGIVNYEGKNYTIKEFNETFAYKHVERVTSIVNKEKNKNPDTKKID